MDGNKARFISKKVRQRNTRTGRPRWQPSRAIKKFRIPRAAERAVAIAESLAGDPVTEEPIVIGYSDCAIGHEAERIREEENEIFAEVVSHGERERARALKLTSCSKYFEDQITLLEVDPEIDGLETAALVEAVELSALAQLAA